MERYKKSESGRSYIYIEEVGKYVYSSSASKILRNLGIDPQEWYDKRVLGLKDKSERPVCKMDGCNNPIKWGGLITGYTSTFCSYKCSSSYVNSHLDEYPHYTEVQNMIKESGGSVGFMKSNPEKYKDSLESYETFNKNGGAWGLMRDNPENFPEFHEKMKEFYSNGGSYGYMISHEEDYKESLSKMRESLDKINSNGGGINLMKSNPEKYKDSLESYETFNKNGGAARNMRDSMSDEEEFIYNCKLSKGTALSKFNEVTTAYLYIQEFSDKVKVGVSKEENALSRRGACVVGFNNSIPPIKERVFSGDIYNVSECEFQIKVNNYKNLYCKDSTELFNLNSINIINNILLNFDLKEVEL